MTKKTKTRAFKKAMPLMRWALLSVFALSLLQPAYAYFSNKNDLLDDIWWDDSEVTDIETDPPSFWGKWLYYDRGDHISVCGYTGTESSITVPSEIDGKPVTEISSRSLGTDGRPVHGFFEDYNGTGTSITVPEGVLSIAPHTFEDSLVLNVMHLPRSLITVGNRAFAGCFNLTEANIPENVVMIGMEAFVQTGIDDIDLPQGLKVIGEGAFKATHLTKINIPDSVTYIGKDAFFSTYIEEIRLPGGLVKLEANLLRGCIRLKRVYISEGTEVIDSGIFESCPNIEEVYFPSTLKEINATFSYNYQLKNLYFAADEAQARLNLGNNNILSRLIGDDDPEEFTPTLAYYYKNVQVTYNTPVPVTEESISKKPLSIDRTTIILLAASTACLTLSALFLTLFLREKKDAEAARAERTKREEEGFHPEVLGAWECEKCGTLNSPIGKYCYKCGRKR
ncbi:MAG: leucine-rich repeat domain-containing protein, partial [Ruminiclostridium sp.]|nr:leucine-rich repeat domain-containing protein [Ruminiclostridium sp.]